MSYTPPAGNAVNATWDGLPAYTPPAGDAINASFLQAKPATGFQSGAFGTPTHVRGQPAISDTPATQFGMPATGGVAQTEQASGFQVGAFGTPVAIPDYLETATGFQTGTFGAPGNHTTVTAGATGFQTGAFGTPANIPNAVGFRSTQFGTPKNRRTQPATGFQVGTFGTPVGDSHFEMLPMVQRTNFGRPIVQGVAQSGQPLQFSTTQFGTPSYYDLHVATNLVAKALWFRPTTFGTPTANGVSAVYATGDAPATQFGTPTATSVQAATGDAPATQLGTPAAVFVTSAVGIAPAQLGTPAHLRTQPATSAYRATRWGTPAAVRSDTYRAYGINLRGKFGRPKGYARFNYPATGFQVGALGAPSAFETHHAIMTAPAARLGRPQLQRNVTC